MNINPMLAMTQGTQQIEDRSHPILQEIQKAAFEYAGWEEDMKKVEGFLFDNLNPSEKGAQRELSRMYKKQLIHHDPIIQLLTSGKFTYPNFSRDRYTTIVEYQNGFDVDEHIDIMTLRQKIYCGDYSHPVLDALKTTCFSYDNWKVDASATRDILTQGELDAYITLPEHEAQMQLDSMKVKQRIHEGSDVIMKLIESRLFTYEGFEEDKESIVDSYIQGFDINDCILEIIDKQRSHTCQRPNSVPSAIDSDQMSDNTDSTSHHVDSSSDVSMDEDTDHSNNTPASFGQCIICLEKPKTHAFVPCGHLATCEECATLPAFSSSQTKICCPVCRKESLMLMKVFL